MRNVGEWGYTVEKATADIERQRDAWVGYFSGTKPFPSNVQMIHPGVDKKDEERERFLINDYARILREDFHQGVTRSQLLKEDYVDFLGEHSHNFGDTIDASAHVRKYLEGITGSELFYYLIPPFETSVYRCGKPSSQIPIPGNLLEGTYYIKVELKEIDPDAKRLRCYLETYIMNFMNLWMIGPYGTVDIIYDPHHGPTGGFEMEAIDGNYYMGGVYSLIPPRYLIDKCGWSIEDYAMLMEKIIYPHQMEFLRRKAVAHNKGIPEEEHLIGCSDLRTIVLNVIALTEYVNASLEMNKPKIDRSNGPIHRRSKGIDPTSAPEDLPKITRTVGTTLKVRSHKSPTRATVTNLRRYRMAVWKRRGHIRRYASGKVIYIPEAQCHRKFLDDGTAKSAQVAIEMKG